MTMHLVRGMSTINTKKRKAKGLTAKDKQAQVEHNKWLRKMGCHPEQLAKKPKTPINTIGLRAGISRTIFMMVRSGIKYTT